MDLLWLEFPFCNKENWSCTWYSDTALSCLVRHKYFLISTGKTWSISSSVCPFVPGTYCWLLANLWSPNIPRSVRSSIISKQRASNLYQKLSVIPKCVTWHFIPLLSACSYYSKPRGHPFLPVRYSCPFCISNGSQMYIIIIKFPQHSMSCYDKVINKSIKHIQSPDWSPRNFICNLPSCPVLPLSTEPTLLSPSSSSLPAVPVQILPSYSLTLGVPSCSLANVLLQNI